MASELAGPNHVCRYTIIDIRNFDEEILLNSPFAADNLLAILTHQKIVGERFGAYWNESLYLKAERATRLFANC